MIRRWGAVLIGLFAGLSIVSPACADDAPRLTIRVSVSKAYNSIMLAHARGEFEKALAAEGIAIKWQGPFPAMAPQMEAMAADELDFGGGSSTAFASAIVANVPTTAFAFTRELPGSEGILVTARSPLKSVKDLVGKSVAVNRGGSGEYLLLKALEVTNIPASAVTRTYMSPADSASALELGNVDAWSTWDPFVSIAEDKFQSKLIVAATDIGSENQTLLVVRTEFLQAHPDVTREVFRLLRISDDWGVAHPQEAGAAWAADAKMPPSIGKLLAAHASNPLQPIDPAQRDELVDVADWMFTHKMLPKKPDVAAHVVDFSDVK
jgi:sulfonate transport system substrate-binding protein